VPASPEVRRLRPTRNSTVEGGPAGG